MSQTNLLESDETMTTLLAKQIMQAISNIQWGSVEIFIQDGKIVQITERNIRKPFKEDKKNSLNEKHASGKLAS